MPKGKKIYEDLSKNYAKRVERRRKREEEKAKNKDGSLVKPAVINNFKANKPRIARSLNFLPAVPSFRRISKTEGKPAVNSSSNVKGLVHKPKPVIESSLDNPTAGAIKQESVPKGRRGRSSKASNKKKIKRSKNTRIK